MKKEEGRGIVSPAAMIVEARVMDRPRRKQIRLPNYDYSTPGACFVTICTQVRRCIVEEQIQAIPARYPAIGIEKYVIMPNHVHLLVSIRDHSGGASPSPTVGPEASSSGGDVLPSLFDVVRVLKSLTTRMARPFLGENPLWQRSYHEHVIRNEDDYRQIWEYIDTNPAKWAEDRYYKGKREEGRGKSEKMWHRLRR